MNLPIQPAAQPVHAGPPPAALPGAQAVAAAPNRPSRTQLIGTVALAFGVSESVATRWLEDEFQRVAA